MPRRAAGRAIPEEEIEWRTWNDQIEGEYPGVTWGSVFSETAAPGIGLFEIAPGAELPKHHHTPDEIYFVVSGEGTVKIYNRTHRLAPGTTVHIPSNAAHVTVNTGESPLRILYMFPGASFSQVDYVIDAAPAAA
ncbi:cupin domain-containing protein [Acuticoccus sp. I52.16.1]|uniref:cupin domain-containing protein n=1 Tax=Acuticoccus sp. I52.16.1 TaxID=2928472 RepID=UPI001FD54312|nr:cupin domain-containing protein [Acuticoccus sp. I52.16.1]UOM37199.1 cupin domain-containing protein [Acuticoccus sp. I52.16.1]